VSRRLGVLGVVMVGLFLILAAQSAYLQFWRAGALNASPLNPRVQDAGLNAARGEIIAANGQVLAQSVASGHGDYPWRRVYPLGSLTSGVVGFSSNYYGQWGLEAQYDSDLTAHQQPPQSAAQVLAPSVAADTITLTLQPALQRIAQSALAGRDGAVVAINPTTGAIEALYANPAYNPNLITLHGPGQEAKAWKSYITDDAHGFAPLADLATQQTFPPGSTFKVITTAAIVTHEPSLLTTVIPSRVCLSLEPYSDTPLCNDGNSSCGGTVAVMLPESCDPGYALLGLDLGAPDLVSEADAFAYNTTIPIDLPGIVDSYFPSVKSFKYNVPGIAYSAIGQQNVRTTALQNAMVAAAIANGGTMMVPHLLSTVIGPDGNVLEQVKPTEWRHALSASQASQIVPLMENVVKFGTAFYVGFLPQDDVAAKTGTAQTGTKGMDTDDWMIAFAPASHPVIAIAVVVPYQNVSATGAEVAGPIMKCMIEGAIALANHQATTNTATTCPS
jgi:penicillin-binding protein A